jgi:hypothetical protein
MKNQLATLVNGALFVAVLAALTQTASASPSGLPAPDAGSTCGLMAAAFAGIAMMRRFRR